MTRRFVPRLSSFFRHDAAEAEPSREIRAHLQLLEDDTSQRACHETMPGWRPGAHSAASSRPRSTSDARGFRWLQESRLDLKLGVRMLVKYPGLSIIGGASPPVGVAIGAAFFAFLYTLIDATLPVEGGDR